MAHHCLQFNSNDPFKGRHLFLDSGSPEGPSGANESNKEKLNSLVDRSGLKAETLKPLKDLLDKEKTKVSEAMVMTALTELERIEKGFAKSKPAYDALMRFATEHLSDGPFNLAERKELALLRNELGRDMILTEKNGERIKDNALIFFENLETHERGLPGQKILAPGRYRFATLDNDLAQNLISLGTLKDMDPTLAGITMNGKAINFQKGNDGKTRGFFENGTYASILNGAEFTVGTPATKPVEVPQENNEVKSTVDEMLANYEEGGDGLASSELDAGREFLPGTPEAQASTEVATEKTRTPIQWEKRFNNVQINIPSFMKGQSQFDQIRQVSLLQNGGEQVAQAIEEMAGLRTAAGETTDPQNMWEALHGGLTSRGGKNSIEFREMFKRGAGMSFEDFFKEYAVLTEKNSKNQLKPEEKEKLANMNHFLEAADTFVTLLPGLAESKLNEADYIKQREGVEYEGDRAIMAKTAEIFFDKSVYGPPAKLNVLQAIGGKNKGGRFVITADNWMTNVARSKSRMKKAGFEKGMIPVISPANQFYMYMELDSPAQMATKLEAQRKEGERIYNTMIEGSTKGNDENREERKSLSTQPITEEMVRKGEFDKDTITAVRYGAMQEAVATIETAQLAEEAALREAIDADVSEIADEMIREMLLDPENQLTPEQINEIKEKAKQGLSLAGVAMLQGHMEEGKPVVDLLRAALGVQKELGKGFTLDFIVEGQTIVPYLYNLSTGIGYASPRFGKKKKWQVDAGARAGFGPGAEGQGLNANLYTAAKYDITKNGLWGIRAGAHLTGRLKNPDLSATASVGVERDLDVQLKLRIEKYMEENKADLEAARLDALQEILDIDSLTGTQKEAILLAWEKKANEKWSEAIETAIEAAIGRDITLEEQGQIMAYEKTTDALIKRKITEKFTTSPLPKILGVTASAGTSLTQGGFGAGIAVPMSWGGRVDSQVIPTQGIRGTTKDSIEVAGRTIEAPLPETEMVYVDLTEEARWAGHPENKAAAMEAMLKPFGDENLTFTPGERFTELTLNKADGLVNFYAEDIESVYDAKKNTLKVNLGFKDKPIVRIHATPESGGAKNMLEVGLTEKSNRSLAEIKASSPYILRWIQTPDGKKGNMEMISNPDYKIPAGEDEIKYRNENTKILDADLANQMVSQGKLEVKSLSREGANEVLEDINNTKHEITTAKLFDEFTLEVEYAKAAAKKVVDDPSISYDKLASKGQTATLDAAFKEAIMEEYKNANPGKEMDENQLTPDLIAMTHQFAMQLERPNIKTKEGVEKVIHWNIQAIKEALSPANHKLLTDYLAKNKELIGAGLGSGFEGEFPEGTEFLIYVNEGGRTTLHGYYDNRIHGKIIAEMEWDINNPNATLESLGIKTDGMTPEQVTALQEQVKAFAQDLKNMEWPKSPFNSLDLESGLKDNENFKAASHTMVGELLLTDANNPYSEAQAAQLREMARNGSNTLNPELAKMFTQNVHELFEKRSTVINGQTVNLLEEVRTGLYEKCFNLTVGHNFKLSYKEVEGEMEFGSSYETERSGSEVVYTRKDRRFALPVTPFIPHRPGTPPKKEGEKVPKGKQITGKAGLDELVLEAPKSGGYEEEHGDEEAPGTIFN